MLSSRINRYLLLLALLFVLAVVRSSDMPGEEMLPSLYHATIHQPLLAPAANAAHGNALQLVELESELAAARLEIDRLKQQLERTHEMQRYLGSLRWEAQPVAVPAWVFTVDLDDYRRTFKIDRGAADGLKVGVPVVTGKALLGIVVAVDKDFATVRRVDDPSFRLEVEIQTQGETVRGTASGDGARGLDVAFVRRTQTLRAGDVVFTTSYDALVPAGLVVGAVREVQDIDEDGFHEVGATPAAALGRWALVHVLLKQAR